MRHMIQRHLAAVLLASCAAAVLSPARADSLRLEHRPMLLRTVLSTPTPMEVRGLRGQLDFDLPVPADASVRDAVVRLVFDSSPGLVIDKSWLQVLLNGSPVKSLPLGTGAGAGSIRVEVPLPGDLLHPGRNRLSALVSHEPTAGCGAGAAARVWTWIDPVNSYALLNLLRPDRPPTLADLNRQDSFLLVPGAPVTILTAARPDEKPALLQAGSLVGQGFALRVGDLPVAFRPVLAERTPGSDRGVFAQLARTWPLAAYQVLMGTANELAPFLGRELAAAITGPYLAVLPIDGNADHVMLVVSGTSEAEVSSAAAAFADHRTPLPRLDRAVVKPLPLDLVPSARSVAAGETYSFRKLGMHRGPTGNGTEPSTVVPVDMPPEFFAADNRKARMTLDFKHTPNLAPGSVVDLRVNSSYRSPIALDKPQEGTYQGYSISFPLNLLRPGENRIVFEPQIRAAEGDGCPTRTEYTRSIDISEHSMLELPPVARVTHQPDLHLFHSTGYPYTAPGEEGRSEIVIPDRGDEGIAGAWTLAAKLAQMADQPLHQLRLGFTPSGESRHLILIGTLDRVAPTLKKWMGIDPDSVTDPRDKESRLSASPAEGAGVTGLPDVVRAWGARAWREAADWFGRLGPTPSLAQTPKDGIGLGAPDGLLGAYAHAPSGKTVTVVAAVTAANLSRSVQELVNPALWSQAEGDLMVWDAEGQVVQSRPVTASVRTAPLPGEPGEFLLYLNSLLASRPLLWILAAVSGLFLFACVTWVGLKLQERHR
jgi:hypothetical protein